MQMVKKEPTSGAAFNPDAQLLSDADLNVGSSQAPADDSDPFAGQSSFGLGQGSPSGSEEHGHAHAEEAESSVAGGLDHRQVSESYEQGQHSYSHAEAAGSEMSGADITNGSDSCAESSSLTDAMESVPPVSSGQNGAPENTTSPPLAEQPMDTTSPPSSPSVPPVQTAICSGSSAKLLLAGPQEEEEDVWMSIIERHPHLSYHQAEALRLIACMSPVTMEAALTRCRYLLDRMERLGPQVLSPQCAARMR